MQMLFEVLFLLALLIPPAAVLVCASVVLGSTFVYWRAHGRARQVERRRAIAIHHPVGS